jgi:hypothetical protein
MSASGQQISGAKRMSAIGPVVDGGGIGAGRDRGSYVDKRAGDLGVGQSELVGGAVGNESQEQTVLHQQARPVRGVWDDRGSAGTPARVGDNPAARVPVGVPHHTGPAAQTILPRRLLMCLSSLQTDPANQQVKARFGTQRIEGGLNPDLRHGCLALCIS